MVKLVFFINTRVSKTYPKVLSWFVDDIHKSPFNKDKNVRLILVVVGDSSDLEKCKSVTETKLDPSKIEYKLYKDSSYEWWGIKAFYDTCMNSSDQDLVLYSHAKDLSHNRSSRSGHSSILGRGMLTRYNLCAEILNNHSDMDKIGMVQSDRGFYWFNFFMCKSSFVKKKVSEPIEEKKDRYYYERWLGINSGKDLSNGYSLAPNTKGQGWHSREVFKLLNKYK